MTDSLTKAAQEALDAMDESLPFCMVPAMDLPVPAIKELRAALAAQAQQATEARESLGWSAADESSFKEQR